MALNLGGIIRLTYSVRDQAGAPTNPTTATLTITQPDGTVAPTTVNASPTPVGTLVYDFSPTQAGRHDVHWATTGPTSADDDVFYVAAPGRMLVSVDAAINHLRATKTITGEADRETMQDLCLVATDAIERDLGRVLVRRTVTEAYPAGRAIVLRQSPVLSITSVTGSLSGLVEAGLYSWSDPVLYLTGVYYGTVTVVYVAGYADPPRVARQAALTLIQSLWQTSQQRPMPFVDESSPEAFAGPALPALSQIPGYDSLRMPAIA